MILANIKLRHTFKNKQTVIKHDNCNVCVKLPPCLVLALMRRWGWCAKLSQQYKCDETGLVHQFKCLFCFSTHIGKTSGSFFLRCNEHKNGIKDVNSMSALPDQAKVCNCSTANSLDTEHLWNSPNSSVCRKVRFLEY